MKKIFYADKTAYSSSQDALREIFSKFFQINDPIFTKNKNGKPYLETKINPPIYFSVTHTNNKLFIAISNQEIGIDAELLTRNVDYTTIVKKFSAIERAAIQSSHDFLHVWTVKESIVKWLGGSIAKDLKKILYENNNVFYENAPLDVRITHFNKDNHTISVCCETSFDDAEWIPLP